MYSHRKTTACKKKNFLSVWKLMKNLRDFVLCLTDKKKKISSQTHCLVPTIDHPFIRWTLKRNLFISVYSLFVYTIPYLLLLMLIAIFSIPFIVHGGIINCCEFSSRHRLSIFHENSRTKIFYTARNENSQNLSQNSSFCVSKESHNVYTKWLSEEEKDSLKRCCWRFDIL